MKIVASRALIDLLRHKRVFTAGDGERWTEGDELTVNPHAEIEPYSHILAGSAIPRAFGSFSYSHSYCDPWMRIGRYSSLSWSIAVMGSSHPSTWGSQSPFSYDPWPLRGFSSYVTDTRTGPFKLHKHDQGPQSVTIGNDVWIGSDVMIKRGVAIGDGAVVGARSVVTRDVPPYAVVVGSPARVIRYRFPEPLIARMLASRWWRYGPDVLLPLQIDDPERFLDGLDESIAAGAAKPAVFEPLTGQRMIAVNDGATD